MQEHSRPASPVMSGNTTITPPRTSAAGAAEQRPRAPARCPASDGLSSGSRRREVGVGLRHAERAELRGQVGDRGEERDVAAADRAECAGRDQDAHEREQRDGEVGPVGGDGRAREGGPRHAARPCPSPLSGTSGTHSKVTAIGGRQLLATTMLPGARRRLQRCRVSARRRFPVRTGVVRGLHVQARSVRGPPHAGGPPGPRAGDAPTTGCPAEVGLRGAAALRPALRAPGAPSGPWRARVRRFWRLLGEVDVVWLLGPHPLAMAFVLARGASPPARGARRAPGLPPATCARAIRGRRGILAAALLLEGDLARSGPDLPARGGGPGSRPPLSGRRGICR